MTIKAANQETLDEYLAESNKKYRKGQGEHLGFRLLKKYLKT